MSEEKQTPGTVTPTDPKNGGDQGGKGDENLTPKNFTQDDVNRIVSDRVTTEQKKSEERFQKLLAKERADWEAKAKMSEEERLEAERSEKEKAIAEKDRQLNLRENKIAAYEKLSELKLPVSFVDMLTDESSEATMKNIETFRTKFEEEVNARVKAQISGETPKDPANPNKARTANNNKGSLLF